MARYLLGVGLTVLALVPMQLGVRSLRRARLPGWSGPPAWLLDAAAGTTIFLVVAQVVGAVGLFAALPVAVGTALAGGLCHLAAPRAAARADASDVPVAGTPVLGRSGRWFAVAVTAVASAPWLARTVTSVRFGMGTVDTLWYHLPSAARFVQEGQVFGLQTFEGHTTTYFYPQDSALLHGFGLSAFDSDLLSPLLNLGWFALALLAGWCIGRPRGVAPVTMAGVAVLLATPVFVGTQPGGAYNDVTALAFALIAAALLLSPPVTRRVPSLPVLVLAATSIGIVLGMKWTGLVTVGAFTIAVGVLAPRRTRLVTALWWVGGVLLTGGSWYLRNLIDVKNPLPPLGFGVLPTVTDTTPSGTIAEFLFDSRAWREDLLPGLGLGYGVLWPLFLACVALGLVLAVVRGGDARVRAVALVGTASVVAYILQPQFLVLFGRPSLFFVNLRYPAVGLALGLTLLPVAVAARRAFVVAAAGAYGVLLVGLQTDPTSWPTGLRDRFFSPEIESYAVVVGVVGALLVFAVGALLVDPRLRRSAVVRWGAVALVPVVLVAGYGADRYSLDHRYRARTTYEFPLPPRQVYRWAQGVHDSRIGVIGNFFQYPLTGDDQSNHVQYVAAGDDRGLPVLIDRCRVWRRVVNAGRYDYVVVAANPLAQDRPREAAWTAPGAASSVVLRDGLATVFRIRGHLDPADCTSEGPG